MKEEVKNLVKLGMQNSSYFKRSTWVKVERVMEYLANKGLVKRLNGEVKYGTNDGSQLTDEKLESLAEAYMRSPFPEHLEALKKLSRETGISLKDIRLIDLYNNLAI